MVVVIDMSEENAESIIDHEHRIRELEKKIKDLTIRLVALEQHLHIT